MLRKSFSLILLLFCCGLVTGPRVVLQVSAWSWMLASYSTETSFDQAVRDTFGGDKPCHLCTIVEKAGDAPSDPPAASPDRERELRLMLGLARPLTVDRPRPADRGETPYTKGPARRTANVPTPPPRGTA